MNSTLPCSCPPLGTQGAAQDTASPLHLPFPDLSSAFSASPKFNFWQGPSASLTFYHDSLTCKTNVPAVPALMDIEMTKREPILCPWPQILDNYHKRECSESCKLNTRSTPGAALALQELKRGTEELQWHQSSAPNEPKLNSCWAFSIEVKNKAWESQAVKEKCHYLRGVHNKTMKQNQKEPHNLAQVFR